MSYWWIGLLLIVFSLILPGCKSSPPPSSLDILSNVDADTFIEQAKVIRVRENIKEWELKAGKIKVYEEENVLVIENLQLNFFEDNHPVSEVRSDESKIDLRTNNAEIEGNVVITSADGLKKIETEYLRWLSREQKFVTDHRVKLLLGKSLFTGESMEADLALKELKIQDLKARGTLEEISRP